MWSPPWMSSSGLSGLSESALSDLRSWTQKREINGEPHFLLYRALNPAESKKFSVTVGAPFRWTRNNAGFTANLKVARDFAQMYGASTLVGVWVPESKLVTATWETPGHQYGFEQEVLVEAPFVGVVHSVE